jgi:type 2 lantibiotic biosynthesis protein LanM
MSVIDRASNIAADTTPGTAGAGGAAALSRGANLAERVLGGLADLPDLAAGGAALADASRRLERWRAREPFGDQGWWRRRLDEGGIDEPGLLALLAEPAEALAARMPPPLWVERFDSLALAGPATAGEPPPAEGAMFAALVAPLLAAARAGALERLRRVAAGAGGPFDPAALLEELYRPLPLQLDRALLRTMVLELNVARLRGELDGDSPEDRFAAFVERLGDPGGRRRLFTAYPVLARQLSLTASLWEDSGVRFAERLAADLEAISATFADGAELGPVEEIVPGLGDRHRGGTTVMSLRFANGLGLVYKPRPVGADVHFQRLLDWCNRRAATRPFRTLAYLDRGDYGWAEMVAPRACEDEAARRRFYRRQGGLLALLHVLNATDLHAENLIAAGDQPVLVDLESLLGPGLPLHDPGSTVAERLAAEATRGSVLSVGLLPVRIWSLQPGAEAIDLSGLGQEQDTPSPLALPTLDRPGTDAMRVKLARVVMGTPDHRPVGRDQPLRLLDYADDILDGFAETYQICERNRPELLEAGGPLEAFAGDEVRVIVRPTMWYTTVLQTGFHPDVLGDGLDRERHFDLLWRQVSQQTALAACVPAERRDLWRGDVPVFTALTDGTELLDSDRQPVAGIELLPGIERARERLRQLGEADLTRQRWLIRGSLATTVIEASGEAMLPSMLPHYQHVAEAEPIGRDRLLAVADVLGYRLDRIAFQTDGSAQWLGVNTLGGRDWAPGPLRADLFHGLAGVALFLGWLGRLTGDKARTRLGRGALATALTQVARGELDRTAGLAGLPGVAYALAQLGPLWEDERLLDMAVGCFERLGDAIGEDVEYDFVGGSAGTIAALRALHLTRPSDWLLEQVRAGAERLLATAERHPSGAGWVPRQLAAAGKADKPIAGFAHGVGSIAWTLFEAAELLGDGRYAEVAREAVRYEQALYRPEHGTWSDLRDYGVLGMPEGEPPPIAWCYGAMGIGLARVLSLPYLEGDQLARAEIATALDTTERLGFGQSHALCHGDVGNVELYLQVAAKLGQPRWKVEARKRMAGVVASARKQGWVCGTPLGVETPGLMVGLAGTGYGMLRVAAPDEVPAVLAMQPMP